MIFAAPTTCGSPDVKVNSTIASPFTYKVSSVIEYICPEGHYTQGSAKRTCGSNGFWTGSAPTCKRKIKKKINIFITIYVSIMQ